MNDHSDPGLPRVAHDPVNDPDGTPASTTATAPAEVPAGSSPDPTGFRFNLDDALARLSEPHQPLPRFKWSAVSPSEPSTTSDPVNATTLAGPQATAPPPQPPTLATAAAGPTFVGSMFPDQESRVRPLTQPTLDPLPEIREATPVDGNPTAHWSTVPVPAVAAAPAVQAVPTAQADHTDSTAFAPSPATLPPDVAPAAAAPAVALVVTGSDAFAAGSMGFTPNSDDAPGPVALRDTSHVDGGVPRLPESNPAAAPPMATMLSSTAKVHAATSGSSATTKGRKKKKRNRFGKVILVMILLAAMVGAALMYGRDYLFPEDWNQDVVPAVDALQLQSGLEFIDPVPVNTLPDAEYAAKVAGVLFGPELSTEWAASVPRWRALGLVDGEPTPESVNAVVGAWKPAFYDPAVGQIYRNTSVTGIAADAAMQQALAAALIDQLAVGSTAPAAVPSATDSLARLAVADYGAELVADSTTTDPGRSALDTLPVPLAHRLIGSDDLGPALLASVGAVADQAGAVAGFDVDLAGVLDVPRTAAPVPALLESDTLDGDAIARGSDYWYTVLAAYLPADTAASAADAIGADLYVPAIRGGQQCVYGTFSATTPEVLSVLQVSTVAWAELAPTQAGASATTLADGVTVQLTTCDPGTAPDAIRTPDVASALLARQIARLAPA